MSATRSKLDLCGERVEIAADDAARLVAAIFRELGCSAATARLVSEHLADSSLCGMESHGLMRTLQYAEQFESGRLRAAAEPTYRLTERGAPEVDGGGGIGVPAMKLAFEHAMALARENGVAALAVRNVGHTGRHGAFADTAAEAGFLTILFGGGNRETWRQVAPHGGARALLPTNPWCVGMPGGERGPVVLDFATSKIAGGWIYAARSAGALLPEGCVIDRDGRPTRDPEDYFNGGAILPAGAHKGYGLALVAELMAEAMLGPAASEANWLLLAIDSRRWSEPSRLRAKAEEILAEIRACPPAPGFERVEAPGEHERDCRDAANGRIRIPERTWAQLQALARRLGAA